MKFALYFYVLIILFISNCSLPAPESKEPAKTNEDDRIKVYLLGTFHFAQTDSTYDILSTEKQASIQELNDVIVGLNPDKIFIEYMPDYESENRIDSLYSAYKNRNKEVSNPNEVWQVGFKVAKRLGHAKLYQCDHPGRYGSIFRSIREYAEENNQMDILEYRAKGVTAPLTSRIDTDSLRNTLSLFEYIKWLNSEEVQRSSHAHYVNVYPQLGHTNVYEYKENYLLGSDLTVDWYRRNIKTYSKMINQLSYVEDAIFLIIGNDHIPILKHLFESNPYFQVMETSEWLVKR